MAIFQNTKIFFTFMLITVNRGMGMLITVICYFSKYLVVVKCEKLTPPYGPSKRS